MSASVMRFGFPDSQRQKMVRLGYVVRCLDGQRVPVDAKDREPGCIPYWGAGTIQDYVADYLFDEQLVLLGEDGAPFDDARRPVAHYSAGKIWVNNHMHVLQVQSTVDAKYLSYALNCVNYSEYLSGAIIPKLTQARMMSIKLPIPPLEQQARIVAFLDEETAKIDHLIETCWRQVSLLEERISSLIEETLLSEKSRFTSDTGTTWPIRRIKTLFALRDERNQADRSEVTLLSLYAKYGVRKYDEIIDRSGNPVRTVMDYKCVRENDIIVNIILAWMGAIGRSPFDGVISPAYDIWIPEAGVSSRYYHYLFRTKWFSGECYKRGKGIMMMRWRTYADQFGDISVPAPPLKIQEKIADYLDKETEQVNDSIDRYKNLVSLLEERRAALVTAVVTGHIEV